MRRITSVTLAAMIAASCASAQNTDGAVVETPAGVSVNGFVGDGTVTLLEEKLRPGGELKIHSTGGSTAAAPRVVSLLERTDATVETVGSCFSFCALYAVLPARSARVTEGSTLLFHSTPALWEKLRRHRPQLISEGVSALIDETSRALGEGLRRRGIDPAILECIDNATEPRIDETRRPLTDGRPRIPFGKEFVWLSPAVLEHFGVRNIQFEWTLAVDARDSFERMNNLTVAWIDDPAQCA
ncbi:MAG: hypothetical protein ACK4MH_02760 [Brevundimonas sp.]|uniref:hypothetical protein n=1 Tax=Brevundimonas sp. TaxID=1871086 RepID=UPI00391D0590